MNRTLRIWIASISVLIVAMVVVGGITRLTNSGLSIVDWKPISGIIPPLNEADWQAEFTRYQQFPQFKLVNAQMTLAQFKSIFFWEYIHRVLGRLIGFVVFIPWLVFWRRGAIDRTFSIMLLVGLGLGGAQGVLGWCMVKSGLVDQPHVSHYRLVAHLTFALVLLAYFLWMFLDLRRTDGATRAASSCTTTRLLHATTALLAVQIIYGAFTAGTRAGHTYNTFPKMGEEWLPSLATAQTPLWINFLQNPIMIQFVHRTLGWLLVACAIALWWQSRRDERSPLRTFAGAFGAMATLQFLLGMFTLLYSVPVSLGAIHQLGACVLFAIAIWGQHSARNAPPVS